MTSARVTGASRAAEQHRANAAARIIGAARPASFPSILGNAAIASKNAAAGATEDHQPPASPRCRTAAGVAVPGASAASLQPACGEVAGNGRDSAARDPAEPSPADPSGRSPRSDGAPVVAPTRGPRHSLVKVGSLIDAMAAHDPGAPKQAGRQPFRTPADTATAIPAPARAHTHRIPIQENPEICALAAAPLMPGNVSRGETGGGAPPSAGGGRADATSVAERATDPARVRPAADGANAPQGPPDAAAPPPASVDPAQPRAIAPETAASGASTHPNPASGSVAHMHATVSGRSRTDPKPVDATLAAARKVISDDGFAIAGLQRLPEPDDGAAPKRSPLAAPVDATAVVSPAPAAPAPASYSDISKANLSPAGTSEQLFGHLLQSIQNPDHEVVLRLHPPELGDLTIRVAVGGREVSAWFATPTPQVQEAISQAIGQLHTDLGNAGYNLSGVWVGADASDPRGRNADLLPPPRDASARSEGVTSPAAKTAASSGSRVSVYV